MLEFILSPLCYHVLYAMLMQLENIIDHNEIVPRVSMRNSLLAGMHAVQLHPIKRFLIKANNNGGSSLRCTFNRILGLTSLVLSN